MSQDAGTWQQPAAVLQLFEAAKAGDASTPLLYSRGDMCPKDSTGMQPLHWAARNGHALVVAQLLTNGADVTATDNSGYTALHLAAGAGRTGVVALLLDRWGAGVHAEERETGSTALSFAAANGHTQIARLLLARGASVGAMDNDGSTPLHDAAAHGHSEVANLLLQRGACVNARDRCGCTALHLASQHGHKAVAALLLHWGADMHIKDLLGESAVDVAVKKSQPEMVALLWHWKEQTEAAVAEGRAAAAAALAVVTASRSAQPAPDTSQPFNVARPIGTWYSYADIASMTRGFGQCIGCGGFGKVYRGDLDGLPVAVKVMDPSVTSGQGLSEFHREGAILGGLHHPHLVLLLGSCCSPPMLVYELMEGGSLQDRLFTSTRPDLQWQDRVRITKETASSLAHLHHRPQPIVHMDIKPSNILLTAGLASKVSDVGLSQLLVAQHGVAEVSRVMGTFGFIDPEYSHSGVLGPMSDIYALGVVMLQLLTGKQWLGVVDLVKRAVASTSGEPAAFARVLDPRAGPWPATQARVFAMLALRCVEFSRSSRPKLREELLPELMKLNEHAQGCPMYQAPSPTSGVQEPPHHFLCPITLQLMTDPVVANDGNTYERGAILHWLAGHNTSPMTSAQLENKEVVPNLSLRSEIKEWLDVHRQIPTAGSTFARLV